MIYSLKKKLTQLKRIRGARSKSDKSGDISTILEDNGTEGTRNTGNGSGTP